MVARWSVLELSFLASAHGLTDFHPFSVFQPAVIRLYHAERDSSGHRNSSYLLLVLLTQLHQSLKISSPFPSGFDVL